VERASTAASTSCSPPTCPWPSAARATSCAAPSRASTRRARAEAIEELLHLAIWNKIHRVEDAVWDPRGKRALFEGLDVERPRILFLGAAEGLRGHAALGLYPGGHTVLVDYDEFCKTERFGHFPEAYPFLGRDPSSGHRACGTARR
jgi:hypothetical protein